MFETVRDSIFSALFLAAILRVTTPILLPSLGALISDRAGVINIGLEGMMLVGAFTGVVVSAYAAPNFGPELAPWIGLISACGVSVSMALLLGLFHLRFKGDLILSGVAMNVLGSAATVAILYELTGNRGDSGDLASFQMPFIQLPAFINDIPLIGGFLYTVFNNQSVMTWLAFFSVFAVWFILYRTPFGMHVRAAGENPSAAESVGIRVTRVRYAALALSGLFAGFGGVHLSMGYLNLFQRDMTSGRGFIALATPLLGGNNPIGTGVASLVFGFFDALAIRIGSLQLPSMLPQMIPYIAVVMALVIYALQTRQLLRVRALRSVEGIHFDANYWRVVSRISVLHVLMAMIAVIGIIISISIFSAPDGFGGPEMAFPIGVIIGLASVAMIVINIPFISRVEQLTARGTMSAAVSAFSLTVYFGLFLSLFFDTIPAVLVALVLAFTVWLVLGGWRLLRGSSPGVAAAA